jgi:hypothetical protein
MITTDKHILFWDGIYSNWHPAEIEYKGHKFANTEQAFMWEKALYFKDFETADKILKTPSPSENKKLGRQVKGFDSKVWMKVCFDIMFDVNMAKYTQIERFGKELIASGEKTLIEASPYDEIWGIGLGEIEALKVPEEQWPGMNLLGKVLMTVRERLKKMRFKFTYKN